MTCQTFLMYALRNRPENLPVPLRDEMISHGINCLACQTIIYGAADTFGPLSPEEQEQIDSESKKIVEEFVKRQIASEN